jgi:hypothetical protein
LFDEALGNGGADEGAGNIPPPLGEDAFILVDPDFFTIGDDCNVESPKTPPSESSGGVTVAVLLAVASSVAS